MNSVFATNLANLQADVATLKMAGWSSLALRNIGKVNLIRSSFISHKNGLAAKCVNYVPVRNSGRSTFMIQLSQYKFKQIKDLLHFYFLVGLIPLGSIALYCNIFIGPAKLTAIPEGYVPKHWEYYEHPITRWIAKVLPTPQECYEKELHKVYIRGVMYDIQRIERKIEEFMAEREDYQAWYFVDPGSKYRRRVFEHHEEFQTHEGKVLGSVL